MSVKVFNRLLAMRTARLIVVVLYAVWTLFCFWAVGAGTTVAFPVILYAIWGIFCWLMCVGRIARYFFVQSQDSTLLLAGSDFCLGMALIGSSLVTAPHARYDFSYLVPWVRFWWMMGFPFFAVATIEKGWFIATRISRQSPVIVDGIETIYLFKEKYIVETKPFYKSKTLWLNVIAVILAALQVFDPTLLNIDPKAIVFVTGVLNFALRFFSDTPLTVKKAKPDGQE